MLKKPEITGIGNIDQSRPAVFIANHLGSFGPVILSVFLPFKFIPWVTHEVTDKKLCHDYLRGDFVEPEMGLKPPLSKLVSIVIGRICVSVMEYMSAIPAYKKSRKIIITVEKSVKELEEGRHVLIFPEISDVTNRESFAAFNSGFINIARDLYERDGLITNFYPICIVKAENTIKIGKGIAFDPAKPLRQEKERIVSYLRDSILEAINPSHAVHNDPPLNQGLGM